ncbi:MAG: hypothetical protein WCV72_04550 [Patescibacteria group bacterium]|jgi:hypothetical protein
MLKKIQQFATEQAERIIGDPAHASRAVLASVLVLGIFSLTLNLSSEIMPELFGARLIESPTEEDLAATAAAQAAANSNIVARAQACSDTRKNKNYDTLINNFEKSLSGILPGAGDLIASYPAVVSERKNQIALEVLKKYANLKYCVPEESFEMLYLTDYADISKFLSAYIQVRLSEDDSTTYPLGALNRAPTMKSTDENSLAEKDLRLTEQQIIDTIDQAIDFATKLDKQTGETAKQLATVTANRVAMSTNTALQTLADIGNQTNNIGAAQAGLLSNLLEVAITDETVPMPVTLGGSYVRVPSMAMIKKMMGIVKGQDAVYSSNVASDLPGLPPVGSKIAGEISRLMNTGEISYGLFNLFKVADRPVVAERLGAAMTLYAGAKLGLDPATPGSEDQIATAASTFAIFLIAQTDAVGEQFCYAIDPEQESKPCFGFNPETPLSKNP